MRAGDIYHLSDRNLYCVIYPNTKYTSNIKFLGWFYQSLEEAYARVNIPLIGWGITEKDIKQGRLNSYPIGTLVHRKVFNYPKEKV